MPNQEDLWECTGNCSEYPPIPPDPPGPSCDCWADGTNYMSFGWNPTPGCCYGCMDEDDWYYDSWATCHVQEACKDNFTGMNWPWVQAGGGNNLGDSITGCVDENGNYQVP